MDPLYRGRSLCGWSGFATNACVVHQLLHFQYGRRVIHFTLSDAVSEPQNVVWKIDKSQAKHTKNPFRLPFSWKTPFGYLITAVAEGASVHAILFCISPVVSFLFGTAWWAAYALDDISSDLTELNGKKTPNGNRMEMKRHFCYIIRMYSDAKQLSEWSAV